MSYPIDSTGVPIIPLDSGGLLFSPPGSTLFPCIPYRQARMCADAICRMHPERRDEMVDWAKWANRQALPRALRQSVRRAIGWEAEQHMSRFWIENLPRAERRPIERVWNFPPILVEDPVP